MKIRTVVAITATLATALAVLAAFNEPDNSQPVDAGNPAVVAKIVGSVEGCTIYTIDAPGVADSIAVICPPASSVRGASTSEECHVVPVGKTLITKCGPAAAAVVRRPALARSAR